MIRRAMLGCLLGGVLCEVSVAADPLPDPLSLEQALALAQEASPAIALSQSRLELARADQRIAASDDRLRLDARLRMQQVQRPDWEDDSYAELELSHRITDFGRTSRRLAAAAGYISASEWELVDARQHLRLKVMRAFFDVILADLRYLAENESMTVAFLRFDRAAEQRELGMLSDTEVGELEDVFRAELDRRNAVERQQRQTRATLARLMGRPTQLPVNLALAEFPGADLPEYEQVLKEVLLGNPALKAQQARVRAAEARLAAAGAAGRPVLSVELEKGEYARSTGNRHDLRASLELAVPLLSGGGRAAARQRARAQLQAERSLLRDMEQRLHGTVLKLVQRLEVLNTRVDSARLRLVNREGALDTARVRYDLEMQADLGNNAARLTEAQWHMQDMLYERAATRATLKALAGKLGAGK